MSGTADNYLATVLAANVGPTDLPTLLQTSDETNRDADGGSRIIPIRGDYGTLETIAAAIPEGTPLEAGSAWSLSSSRLVRENGGIGLLRLVYSPTASSSSEPGAAEKISEKWGLSTAAQTLSILRYCGVSEGANAYRPRIESWMNEPDGELKSDFKYHNADGAVLTLTARDQVLAAKILAGIDGVQRHYPAIRRTVVLTAGSFADKIIGELDHFKTAAALQDAGAPATLTGRAAYWLKTGEDVQTESKTRRQTLTETWIGGASFDENLYGDGASRWEPASI